MLGAPCRRREGQASWGATCCVRRGTLLCSPPRGAISGSGALAAPRPFGEEGAGRQSRALACPGAGGCWPWGRADRLYPGALEEARSRSPAVLSTFLAIVSFGTFPSSLPWEQLVAEDFRAQPHTPCAAPSFRLRAPQLRPAAGSLLFQLAKGGPCPAVRLGCALSPGHCPRALQRGERCCQGTWRGSDQAG